ncbi:PREDICTED: uncharacterized protein LOC107187360 isoform X1 [Dufourea novaeangliae]|uniref:Uncharacterized protein n=1 Tax=Dufourea novaeangliae TaxID=178035 RepID=A0A154PCM6_DUFNO|nr:PREDICTED: uncharacterized protein LOC107187360 isoform X1 [Dufourea novaeangliae]KZC09164.1 hypothetical protein WN55_00900 [Dufourea novaeangliae]
MEYTLEDAFEALKDAKRERVQQIEELLDEISKVDPITFKQTSSPEEISTKQHKLCQSLLTEILQEEPKDYPFPKTSDLHVEALTELQEEVRNAEALHESLKERLSAIEENVSYLENKKLGLEKMEQAYLDHVELNTDRSYVTEHVITKRMFNEVKTDLDQLITKLFPDNQNVRVFLAVKIQLYFCVNGLFLQWTYINKFSGFNCFVRERRKCNVRAPQIRCPRLCIVLGYERYGYASQK